MATSSPELDKKSSSSIQQRYAKAHDRYSGLDIVLRDPKIPPREKLIGGIYAAYIFAMVGMSYAKGSIASEVILTLATLVIANFIYYEHHARTTGRTGPPFPRPKYRRKKRHRELA
jgi:hypothetical protein